MILSKTRPSRYGPHLQRVLLIDVSVAATKMTAEVLKDLGAANIYVETTDAGALALCKQVEPQLIVTELNGPKLDGLRFVRSLRRSTLNCRAAPVIVTTLDATASAIIGARNAGVHEFLRRPFAIRDLTRRLEAVTMHGRDWIEGMGYVGPDRRRFNSGDYKGPRKRKSDTAEPGHAARIEQALRILVSAIKAIESDPVQALRSMRAQAEDLKTIAVMSGDLNLLTGASALQRYLTQAAAKGALLRPEVEGNAAALLALLPAEASGAAGMPAFELA